LPPSRNREKREKTGRFYAGSTASAKATYYNWKAKYGYLQVSEVQKSMRLEEEKSKLERVIADVKPDLGNENGGS
jgi:hypothetical protein